MSVTYSKTTEPMSHLDLLRNKLNVQQDHVWSILDQILVSSSNFLIGVVLARVLSLAAFGQIALVMVSAVFMGPIIYYLTVPPLHHKRQIGAHFLARQAQISFIIACLGSLVVSALLFGLSLTRNSSIDWALVLAAVVVIMGHTLHDLSRHILFARKLGRRAVVIDVARFGSLAICLTLCVAIVKDYDGRHILFLVGASALIPALFVFLPMMMHRVPVKTLLARLRANWLQGRWLLLMVFVTTSLEQLVFFVTAMRLGDEAVGGLRMSLYCLGIYSLVLATLEKTVPRRAAEALREGGRQPLVNVLIQTGLYTSFFITVLMLFFAIPAGFWLALAFGEKAARFAPAMQLVTLGFGITFLREFAMVYLRSIGRTEMIFRSFVIASGLSALVAWPVAASYGLIGMVGVLVLMHALSCILIYAAAIQDFRQHREELPQ